ncbi:aldehyde dehydrogenase family protein [Nocardia sp. NPDC056100]|uniref:aldehyde dehydrogenase family protein n=1 Tax=Nocardia sp. NPDC056100 TaxID=3345712 RepID=UPI0035E2E98E
MWTEPHGTEHITLIDPRDGKPSAVVRCADAVDVDAAVSTARRLFDDGPQWPLPDRLRALSRLAEIIERRVEDFADIISVEIGAPAAFARQGQVGTAVSTLRGIIEAASTYRFAETVADSVVIAEPAGPVAAITPWNFPLHQALGKVGAALACGCPVVLKPSELTPLSSYLLAEAALEAGVPAGWLSVLAGRGEVTGRALVEHPDIEVVSFTGSTEVGRSIAATAGARLARVALELGGKSPSVLLDDLDDDAFAAAVTTSLRFCLMNAGQTCAAWTRMIVPATRYADAAALLRELAVTYVPGENLGPLVSATHWERVTGFLREGVDAGAEVIHGEPAPPRPAHGYYLNPVVFGRVTPSMRIVREEIFGPVLVVQTHSGDDDAVRLANDTCYGLGGAVFGADQARAVAVARRIRSGSVHINGLNGNRSAPFGGFKQSGIGREFGRWGLEEFLEVKSIQPPPGFAYPISHSLLLEENHE